MSARIPEQVRDKILADYAAGMTGPMVARKHKVGPASVYRITQVAEKNRGRKFTSDLLDAAAEDYVQSGDSIRRVAQRHPVSEDTLRLELKRRNLIRPNGTTIPTPVKRAAVDDFLAGMSIADASKKHDVARSTIACWLDQEGLGAEDREGESPSIYSGGWVVRGGIRVPLKPARSRRLA